MNPFGFYYRGRLQKKIFVWFGISIAVTTAVVLFVSGHLRRDRSPFAYQRTQIFLAHQFVAVWDDPARRDELARELARDLSLDVHLTDSTGKAVLSLGNACRKGAALKAPIERAGQSLGQLEICEKGQGPRFLLPVLVAAAMLWGTSGAIARRLVRPLAELSRVARDIGEGHLKSRVSLSRRHGSEFRVVGDVINQMASRIEKQLADQRALLATVSHEIRTPLSRMRLLIEFVRDKTEENQARLADARDPLGELRELEREITDIDTLVSDLLASSRVDFTAVSKTTLDPVEIGKTALSRAAIDVARLARPAELASFEGDPTLVARAVMNLLENAKRHAGGVLALRIDVTARHVAFIVEDDGPGFAPGEEARIFEPFYKRAAAGSTGEESVGLGLALVKKIAEAHRGRVFAENRKEGGARVGVAFAR